MKKMCVLYDVHQNDFFLCCLTPKTGENNVRKTKNDILINRDNEGINSLNPVVTVLKFVLSLIQNVS